MSRDVLAPPLMRMSGGRCYRVNLIHEDFGGGNVQHGGGKSQAGGELKGYIEKDDYTEDYNDEEDDACLIEELDSGFYKHTMHVSNAFYGGIIGFKGSTKRRIEAETKAEIFVPRIRDGAGTNKKEEITIKAQSREYIFAARRQLNILIESLRKRMTITHFIGVSFKDTEVQTKFSDFKKKVLELELPGIDESLFQKDEKLHVTLEVFVLLDDIERKTAVDLLKQSRDYLVDLKVPFDVKVRGLEIMNDDPSSVKVLYACIDAADLQIYADKMKSLYKKHGFSQDKFKKDSVKMHLTLMNSKFSGSSIQSFDAREILKKFGNFDFGSAVIDEVSLFVRNLGEGIAKEYKVTGSIKLSN